MQDRQAPTSSKEINYWPIKTSLLVISKDLGESGISIQTREIVKSKEEKQPCSFIPKSSKNRFFLGLCLFIIFFA